LLLLDPNWIRVVVEARRVNKSKGQVFVDWANRIHLGKILQVQLLGKLSLLLLVFFVRANHIDQRHGDVGCCGDVAVLTSASKGNWHMMTSSGNTPPLWLVM